MIENRKAMPVTMTASAAVGLMLMASTSWANQANDIDGASFMNQPLWSLNASEQQKDSSVNPFILDERTVQVSANDIRISLVPNNQPSVLGLGSAGSEPVSFSFDDDNEGKWLVSLDLSSAAAQSELNTQFSGSFQPANTRSQFFVTYGDQSLPVSISFEEPNPYQLEGRQLNQQGLAIGFNQQISESWDVTISYLKSEIEMVTTESALAQLDNRNQSSYRLLYDFNQDGAPEAINLMSDLPGVDGFEQELEGIEITISRQINDSMAVGSSLELSKGQYNTIPLGAMDAAAKPFQTNAVSLYGGMKLADNWTLGANINHQDSKLHLDSATAPTFKLDETTLDIGLQYQTKWNQTGLVIRIDLMNLLGGADLSDSLADSMDLDARGLAPYTFQSPKYIKLSGSINF